MSPPTTHNAVAITGIGVLSPAGLGLAPLWERVLAGEALAKGGVASISDDIEGQLPRARGKRFSRFAVAAAREALASARWSALTPDDGLVIGSTTGNVLEWERDALEAGDDLGRALRRHEPLGVALEELRAELAARGPARLVSSACSSSTQAIALGARWIASGRVRRCLVGGVEVLSRLTVDGFRSMQLLSPEPARPFDARRNGINLSEGAAFLCLERDARDRALGFVTGWGMSGDAYHMTAPHPEGRGSVRAIRAALDRAGLRPDDIDGIHAHGTGSAANDLAESRALAAVFRDACPPVASTKGAHGHALGASGALEIALCLEAMKHGCLPPTTGFEQTDTAAPAPVSSEAVARPIRHLLKNSLGFGGTNASLVVSHCNLGKESR